jgi:CRP-like cAMP-binding protein
VDRRGLERSFTFRGPRTLVCVEALRHEPSAFQVRALSPVKLCSCSAAELLAAIDADGSAARAVIDLLLSELDNGRSDQQWRLGSSLSRVARFVLACGTDKAVLPYFQKQIAAGLLGIRPETFSRCITQLTGDRVIGKDWKDLQILDRSRLERLAEGRRPSAGAD